MNGNETCCRNCQKSLNNDASIIPCSDGNIICSKCLNEFNNNQQRNFSSSSTSSVDNNKEHQIKTTKNTTFPSLSSSLSSFARNQITSNNHLTRQTPPPQPPPAPPILPSTHNPRSHHHHQHYKTYSSNTCELVPSRVAASSFSSSLVRTNNSSRPYRRDSEPSVVGQTSSIDSSTSRVIEAINKAAEEKIREIEQVRVKLIEQIRLDREELIANENKNMEHNQQKNLKNPDHTATINPTPSFISIYDTVPNVPTLAVAETTASLVSSTTTRSNNKENSVSSRYGTLENRVPTRTSKDLVDEPSVGIRFNATNERFKVSELGAIEYDDAIYRIEARNKIALLNNDFQYKLIDLSVHVHPVTLNKRIELLAPDKVLLIHEKAVGRVMMTHLKVIFQDQSIMYETKRQYVDEFYATHASNSKHILIAYHDPSRGYLLFSYDPQLRKEREREVDITIDLILTSETRFYLIEDTDKHNKHLIYEFDYEFNRLQKPFGQNKWPKKPFYIPVGADVFAVENERIYLKLESRVRVLSRSNGLVLNELLFEDLHTSSVFLDVTSPNDELFLVFNGYQKVSLYDIHGEVVASNKIRHPGKFDEFKFIRAGYFGFINNENMLILIV